MLAAAAVQQILIAEVWRGSGTTDWHCPLHVRFYSNSDRDAASRQAALGARSNSAECWQHSLAEPRGWHYRLPARDGRWTIRLQRLQRGTDVGQQNHTMQ
jgi:hypothetical protein